MNEELLERFLPRTYGQQGIQSIRQRESLIRQLMEQRRLPSEGWDDSTIEQFLQQLSTMDSNNFRGNSGVGEREGRVFSAIVYRRHFGMAHGIGRSGDIAEIQPKAAGSSILYALTTSLVTHALTIAGLGVCNNCLPVPMATGMTITLTLLALRSRNPEADLVIWPRIDQKSSFKSILTAGLTPLIVQNVIDAATGEMQTNVDEIGRLVDLYGCRILCVLSTTSCFAPRQPDLVDKIGVICKERNIAHVINNAYGVQCKSICKQITRACRTGRVDAVIQSTDKNFMVPVGGAIVASPSSEIISLISSTYPGRASGAPITDLLITLLSMGESGFRDILTKRERMTQLLTNELREIATSIEERIIPSSRNTISFALSLGNFDSHQTVTGDQGIAGGGGGTVQGAEAEAGAGAEVKIEGDGASSSVEKKPSPNATFLGSMLFQRNVSGCRVVQSAGKITNIGGHSFINWGSHHNEYPCTYLTAASSVGMTEEDILLFSRRLKSCLEKVKRKEGRGRKGGLDKEWSNEKL